MSRAGSFSASSWSSYQRNERSTFRLGVFHWIVVGTGDISRVCCWIKTWQRKAVIIGWSCKEKKGVNPQEAYFCQGMLNALEVLPSQICSYRSFHPSQSLENIFYPKRLPGPYRVDEMWINYTDALSGRSAIKWLVYRTEMPLLRSSRLKNGFKCFVSYKMMPVFVYSNICKPFTPYHCAPHVR